MNIKFYVKLEKNESDMCSTFRGLWRRSYKNVKYFCDINCSKKVARTWNMMKKVVVQDVKEPMKMIKKCGMWCIQTDV